MENSNWTGITVKDLATYYLGYQSEGRNAGELSAVHLQDCLTILQKFTATVGKQTVITEIAAALLHGYRAELMKRYTPRTVNRHVSVVKTLFNYGLDYELIDHVPNLWRALPKVSRKQVRDFESRKRRKNGSRMFLVEQVRPVLAGSSGQMKAMVLHCVLEQVPLDPAAPHPITSPDPTACRRPLGGIDVDVPEIAPKPLVRLMHQ